MARRLLILAFAAAPLILAARAQQPQLSTLTPTSTSAPTPEQSGLQASVTAQTEYNSNINENNNTPLAGWEQEISGELGLDRASPTGTLELSYRPYLQIFDQDSALNSVNQIGEARGSVLLSPRWTLRGDGSGGYMEQLPSNTINGLQPVLSSTTYSVVPRAREETGQGNLSLDYAVTPRITLEASGGYTALSFPGVPAGAGVLNGVNGSQGGLAFNYAATGRTSWGWQYQYENFSVAGSSHLAADTFTLTYAHAFTPLTQLQLYAGPQYSQVHDIWTSGVGAAALTTRMYRVRTYPTAGGELAHTGSGFNWSLQADRQISNGGGALPFPVTLSDARATLSPLLPNHWQVRFGGHVSQMSALTSGALASNLRMAAVGVEVGRPLNRNLQVGVDVNYLAQEATGALVLAPGVNRFVGGVQVQWHWPRSSEAGGN